MEQSAIWKLVKISLGCIILIAILWKIGIKNIIDSFLAFELSYLPVVVILVIVITLGDPLRLITLYWPVRQKEIKLSEFYKQRLLSLFAGTVTPWRVGELSILYLIKRTYKIKVRNIAYTLGIDKGITFVIYLTFSIIGFFAIYSDVTRVIRLIVTVGITAVLIIIALLICSYCVVRNSKIRLVIHEGVQFLQKYSKENKRHLIYNLLLTVITVVLITLLGKITFFALGKEIEFATLFYLNNIIGLLSIVPFNIMGITAKEIGSIYLFTLIQIPPEITTAMIVIVVTIRYIIYAICLFVLTVSK